MFTDKLSARVVGVLFIVASVTAIVGGSLVGDNDALGHLVGVQHRVITGVVIELVLVVSVVGIAVLAFPVLRRHDEGLALGYVAARTLEAAALLGASVTAVVAVALSDNEAPAVAGRERVDDLVVAEAARGLRRDGRGRRQITVEERPDRPLVVPEEVGVLRPADHAHLFVGQASPRTSVDLTQNAGIRF